MGSLQLKRGLATDKPTLLEGEQYFETNTPALRVGNPDGTELALTAGGAGGNTGVKTMTADYGMTDTDGFLVFILGAAAGAAKTLTLAAAASNVGRTAIIINLNATYKITIDGNASETVCGATTIDLVNENSSITLVCDGANWHRSNDQLDCMQWSYDGNLYVADNVLRRDAEYDGKSVYAYARVDTAPTDADAIFDIYDATSAALMCDDLTIAATYSTGSKACTGVFAKSDRIRMDIKQKGSTVAGANVCIRLYYVKRGL